MDDFDRNAPVLVAAGESSGRMSDLEWHSPSNLAGIAIKAALTDSGQAEALSGIIDCVAATRTFEDSGVQMGTGSPDNVPEAYAIAGGITPKHFIYGDVGGHTPQSLVTELAGAVQRREYRAIVIVGAEANATAKRARKQGRTLNWHRASNTSFEDRLSRFPILSRTEIRHGIISMPLAYSLIETARRGRRGLDMPAYQTEMAALWSAFAQKSAASLHAQFARDWSTKDLQQAAQGNYQLTQIYRRWMVAQDAVDLGAALVLTTAGTARDIGIAADKMIWLVGTAQASEPPLSERSYLSGSRAQEFAIDAALDQAGVTADDLGPLDIYSCFPCAVFAAADTLTMPHNMPQRSLGDYTLTGGLSFFGGPGNGYSLHGLAAMVRALRADGLRPAMVTANGGVMSKHAAGIYIAQPPPRPWQPQTNCTYAAVPIVLDDAPSGTGRVLSFAWPVTKEVMGPAALLLEMESGARAMAVLDVASDIDLLDAIVEVTPGEKRHSAILLP